MLHRPRDQMK